MHRILPLGARLQLASGLHRRHVGSVTTKPNRRVSGKVIFILCSCNPPATHTVSLDFTTVTPHPSHQLRAALRPVETLVRFQIPLLSVRHVRYSAKQYQTVQNGVKHYRYSVFAGLFIRDSLS
ncbi:hypothetical protein BS78_04G281600 [Paspalum vaginatum]|nr:hypothetical protein BS78_04G281600 [Paspalum vaginatum]